MEKVIIQKEKNQIKGIVIDENGKIILQDSYNLNSYNYIWLWRTPKESFNNFIETMINDPKFDCIKYKKIIARELYKYIYYFFEIQSNEC